MKKYLEFIILLLCVATLTSCVQSGDNQNAESFSDDEKKVEIEDVSTSSDSLENMSLKEFLNRIGEGRLVELYNESVRMKSIDKGIKNYLAGVMSAASEVPVSDSIKDEGVAEIAKDDADLANALGIQKKDLTRFVHVSTDMVEATKIAIHKSDQTKYKKEDFSVIAHLIKHNKNTAMKALNAAVKIKKDACYIDYVKNHCSDTLNQACADSLFTGRMSIVLQLLHKGREIPDTVISGQTTYTHWELGRLCPPKCPSGGGVSVTNANCK